MDKVGNTELSCASPESSRPPEVQSFVVGCTWENRLSCLLLASFTIYLIAAPINDGVIQSSFRHMYYSDWTFADIRNLMPAMICWCWSAGLALVFVTEPRTLSLYCNGNLTIRSLLDERHVLLSEIVKIEIAVDPNCLERSGESELRIVMPHKCVELPLFPEYRCFLESLTNQRPSIVLVYLSNEK